MFSLSGPVPLLVLAVLMSVALFLAYRDIAALKAKVVQLEASLPGLVEAAVAPLRQNSAPPFPFPLDYNDIEEDLPEYAEEAARAIAGELQEAAAAAVQSARVPAAVVEDVTEPSPTPLEEPVDPEGTPGAAPAVVIKRRGGPKKSDA